jgi:hypothetical protein
VSDEQKNPESQTEDTEGHSVNPAGAFDEKLHSASDRQATASEKSWGERQSDEDDTEGNSMNPTGEWAEGVASASEKNWSERQHQADER